MIVTNCFRYLGFDKYSDWEEALRQIHIMRLEEYAFRMRIHNWKTIDKEHDMHLQAWLNARVKDTKEKGKDLVPVYRNFEDFYGYESRIKELGINTKPKKKITETMKTAIQMASEINT